MFIKSIQLRQRNFIFGCISAFITIVILGLVLYASLVSELNIGIGYPFIYYDKFLHFFGYMVLTFFLVQSFYHLLKISRTKSIVSMLYIAALIGALVEVLQYYFTSGIRSTDIVDFVADVLGALTVFVLLQLKTKEKSQFAKHPK